MFSVRCSMFDVLVSACDLERWWGRCPARPSCSRPSSVGPRPSVSLGGLPIRDTADCQSALHCGRSTAARLAVQLPTPLDRPTTRASCSRPSSLAPRPSVVTMLFSTRDCSHGRVCHLTLCDTKLCFGLCFWAFPFVFFPPRTDKRWLQYASMNSSLTTRVTPMRPEALPTCSSCSTRALSPSTWEGAV